MDRNKQIETKVETKGEKAETKQETKSLRVRTGIKAGPVEFNACW
jgi:hypothetical protein